MDVLRTENLTRLYRQGDVTIYASKNINISVKQNEMVAIVGASGSGKTTLLNLLGGLDKPTSGTVFVDGHDIYATSDDELSRIRRQKIGYVFQRYNLIPIMSAKENIVMPLLLDAKRLDNAYFQEIVDVLGIGDRLNHLPSELSGGQQQRVAIARALINKPSIILADEPTGNLDKAAAEDIMGLLQTIHQRGNTIVLVTHDKKYADMCGRKILIGDGEIAGR